MNVYLVFQSVSFEGADLVGVFESEESARTAALAIVASGRVRDYEFDPGLVVGFANEWSSAPSAETGARAFVDIEEWPVRP